MKIIIFAILILGFQSLKSQAISGTVFDIGTGEEIEGASVYFGNTSIGTITDGEGYFSIDSKFNSNTNLVISHIGYLTVTIPYQKIGENIRIGMKEEFFEIPEVVLVADPFSRQQKLEVFRLEFLGESKGGINSEILNEDALDLYFDVKTNTLFAHSSEPIELINNYLGYQIKFDLIDFQVAFKQKSLKRIDNIYKTIIYGHALFTDIVAKEERFANRRNRAYLGSIQHFIRTIWNGSWLDESFGFSHELKKIDVSEAFKVSIGNNLFTKNVSFKLKKFKISYKKGIFKYWSSIDLLSGNTITVDKYGNYTPYLQLKFGGAMSNDRIGDLLPLDFELVEVVN